MCHAPPRVAAPYTDLTSYIAAGELEALGEYIGLMMNATPGGDGGGGGGGSGGLTHSEFAAAGRKHADAIVLTDRVGYGTDLWPETYGFLECRQRRGSAEHWRHNRNAELLPEIVAFVDRLPMFSQVRICYDLSLPSYSN